MRFLFVTYGARTQPQVGVRKTLAFSCVMQRVYLSRHFVSFRNISQNCPMPSSPVNVTFCPSTSIRYCERVRSKGQEPNHRLAFGKRLRFLALCSVFILAVTLCRLVGNLRNGGPRGILCTRGDKAHTSKRVSIIAPDNAISKVQLSGTPKDTFVLLGKRRKQANE